MWTPTTCREYSRIGLRYQTDLTDKEWWLHRRSRKWPIRAILDVIFYVLRDGIPWRLLPKEFPSKSAVYDWFCRWRDDGTLAYACRIDGCFLREKIIQPGIVSIQ